MCADNFWRLCIDSSCRFILSNQHCGMQWRVTGLKRCTKPWLFSVNQSQSVTWSSTHKAVFMKFRSPCSLLQGLRKQGHHATVLRPQSRVAAPSRGQQSKMLCCRFQATAQFFQVHPATQPVPSGLQSYWCNRFVCCGCRYSASAFEVHTYLRMIVITMS